MKHTYKGLYKHSDEIPQPIGVVLGGNLRQNSKPKVKHGGSQMEGGRRILSPDEVRALGIPTDPVLVISPVPRTPPTPPTTPTTPAKRR
jgi:hypothetical protein